MLLEVCDYCLPLSMYVLRIYVANSYVLSGGQSIQILSASTLLSAKYYALSVYILCEWIIIIKDASLCKQHLNVATGHGKASFVSFISYIQYTVHYILDHVVCM